MTQACDITRRRRLTFKQQKQTFIVSLYTFGLLSLRSEFNAQINLSSNPLSVNQMYFNQSIYKISLVVNCLHFIFFLEYK